MKEEKPKTDKKKQKKCSRKPPKPREGFYSFDEAKAVVQDLGIKRARYYHKKCFDDNRLPYRPKAMYKGVWKDWPDFLSRPSSDVS